MPEIYNYESNTLVSGTDKLDYIYNSGGKYVTIQGSTATIPFIIKLVHNGMTTPDM